MRVRTEAKRDAIVDTAALLFREMGYERTSMATISARVGGSKATLYGYFPSKESLFVAVIERTSNQAVGPAIDALENGSADLRGRLQRFGEGFLSFLSSPETVGGRRMVIAEAGHSDIGRTLYESGPKKAEARIAAVLTREMKAGHLRKADADVATLQLIALVEAETLLPNLLGLIDPLTKREVTQMVGRAVATFLAAYAPAS